MRDAAAQALINLIKLKADAVVAMHRPGENADDIVERLVADGWTLKEDVDRLLGRRVRYLEPPEDMFT